MPPPHPRHFCDLYLVFLEKRLHACLILANVFAGDNAQCVQQPGVHIISISEKLKHRTSKSTKYIHWNWQHYFFVSCICACVFSS